MFCKNCGSPISGTPFCTNCGAKVEQSVPVAPDELEATVMTPETAAAFAAAQPAQPAYQEPVQPVYQEPVQPVYQEPAQPVYQEPAQPVYQEPAQPVYQEPVQPVYQEPVQPAYQQPAYTNPNQYGYGAPQYQPQPPKKKNTGMIIGVVAASLVAVALIVVIVLFATGTFDSKKDKDDDDDDKPRTTASEQVSENISELESQLETEASTRPNPNGEVTVPAPTQPPQNTSSYEIGRSYTYIPISITELGYGKMVGMCNFGGDRIYVEADYGNNIYDNDGTFYISYVSSGADVYVIIDDGYFKAYNQVDGEFVETTDEYEADDIENMIAMLQLMGFDLDSGFNKILDAMPLSYTYSGVTNHPNLGVVEVFNFEVDGSTYVVWVDQDSGVTARLYEDGEIIIDFESAYASNSIVVPDYSNY